MGSDEGGGVMKVGLCWRGREAGRVMREGRREGE